MLKDKHASLGLIALFHNCMHPLTLSRLTYSIVLTVSLNIIDTTQRGFLFLSAVYRHIHVHF